MWGKTAAGAFLAVTVAAVSGCGPGLKGPHGEKTAAPKTVSVTKAAADFQAVINDYDISAPMLLARSRHASVRSLERYARPGVDAVARHGAERDPAARRRNQ
ncbi:hypothetical protein [Streptomyces sp. NPDC056821]|uniref:hypothetical protein n=1 Tax=unclassified Streptomyces TaxID=2593676 RepID=UPI0036A7B1EC